MKMVKVRAKQFGQTPEGGFVHEGEEFEVPEGMVSKIWMERLDAKGDAEQVDAPRRGRRAAEKPADPSESGDDAGDPGNA